MLYKHDRGIGENLSKFGGETRVESDGKVWPLFQEAIERAAKLATKDILELKDILHSYLIITDGLNKEQCIEIILTCEYRNKIDKEFESRNIS